MSRKLFSVFLLLATFSYTSVAEEKKSKTLPLWEIGLGFISFNLPHYRGSDQSKTYFFPTPYGIFRGDKLYAENSYMRGRFLKWKKLSLNLSYNLGMAVNSDENVARSGMPDLDYIFEFGPMTMIDIWQSENKTFTFDLQIPTRAVFATDFTGIKHIGFFYVPFVAFSIAPRKWNYNWGIEFSLASMIGSNNYHDYFYSVAPQFATPTRPAYDAKAGYHGSHATMILSKRYKDFSFLPFFRYDYLKGAVYDDSPLFKSRHYFVAGLAFTWFIWKSKTDQKGQVFR